MNQNKKLWEEFKASQDAFYFKRGELIKNPDLILILKEAFKDPTDTITVLRLFLTFVHEDEIELIKNVLPELVDESLTGNPTSIYLSRKVIFLIDKDWLTSQLEDYVKEIKLDGEEEWILRRTAELYKYLNIPDLLSKHISFCRSHPLEEVREIADDFSLSEPVK